MSQYNLRNPAVKRLMKEAEELLHPTDEYHAQPVDDNLFEWHFTIRGPPNSDFEGGVYHGRITLPPDYPMKPPSIILLTPNGRFETNKKICLSISGHHPESWQPSWSIRTALLAIIGFMPTHGNGALGSLDYTPQERQQLAVRSQTWKCPECGCIKDIFKKKSSETQEEQNDTSEIPPESQDSQDHPPSTSLNEDNPSEKTESELIPSKEDDTTVVHRQKSPEVPEVTNEVQPIAPRQNNNNFLYSAFIFVIVSIFIFLCVRRILYM